VGRHTEARMGDGVEQLGLALGREAAAEEQGGLHGADGRVHGEAQLAVGEVAAGGASRCSRSST